MLIFSFFCLALAHGVYNQQGQDSDGNTIFAHLGVDSYTPSNQAPASREIDDRQNALASLLFALSRFAPVRPGGQITLMERKHSAPPSQSRVGRILAPQLARQHFQKLHCRTGVVSASESDQAQKFHEWLGSNGVSTKAVKGGELPGYGFSLISEGVAAGEQLLAVPASLHISPSSVRKSPVGEAVAPIISQDDDSALLALGLLQEVAKGEDSVLAPYIDLLPGMDKMDGLPLLWNDEDLSKHFAGSHLQAFVAQQRNAILQQWQSIESDVLPEHPDSLFPRDVFNAPGYLWAHAICLTRALPFGDELSLIPYLDLANHRDGTSNKCSIGVFDGSSSVSEAPSQFITPTSAAELEHKQSFAVITAGEDIPKGTQVFIDYDESESRSSWEMLFTYGFAPGTTQQEWVTRGGRPMFFEGLRRDDPLFMQKSAVLVALGLEEDAWEGVWLDLKADSKQCVSMAPMLRFAHLAPNRSSMSPEIASLAESLQSYKAAPRDVWQALQKPLDQDTEALVSKQVVSQCEEAIAQLPSEEELVASASRDLGTEYDVDLYRAKLAAQVLIGERKALETCAGEWRKHLPAA